MSCPVRAAALDLLVAATAVGHPPLTDRKLGELATALAGDCFLGETCLDLAGLTDAQLACLGLHVGALLWGGADRAAALEEIKQLHREQYAVSLGGRPAEPHPAPSHAGQAGTANPAQAEPAPRVDLGRP